MASLSLSARCPVAGLPEGAISKSQMWGLGAELLSAAAVEAQPASCASTSAAALAAGAAAVLLADEAGCSGGSARGADSSAILRVKKRITAIRRALRLGCMTSFSYAALPEPRSLFSRQIS